MSNEEIAHSFQAKDEDIGKRLDVFLAEHIADWSRSRLKKIVDEGDVLVNDKAAKSSYKLRAKDAISVELKPRASDRFEPEDIPLDIVFEDEYLAVINKPAGMIVHPGAGVSGGTLANAVAFHFYRDLLPQRLGGAKGEKPAEIVASEKEQNYEEILPQRREDEKGEKPAEIHSSEKEQNYEEILPQRREDAKGEKQAEILAFARTEAQKHDRVGIVHRLDKDTSGLIVVAKNELTLEKLSAQFSDRRVSKSYVALVHGFVRKLSGKIDEPIARDRKNRVKMAVDKRGRNAVSFYKVRQRFERFTLLDVKIKTGRTHQIRVHLAHIKHPVVGDETYNEGRDKTISDAGLRKAIKELGRVYLHAEKLSFTHPVTKETLEFTQAMPRELTELMELL